LYPPTLVSTNNTVVSDTENFHTEKIFVKKYSRGVLVPNFGLVDEKSGDRVGVAQKIKKAKFVCKKKKLDFGAGLC